MYHLPSNPLQLPNNIEVWGLNQSTGCRWHTRSQDTACATSSCFTDCQAKYTMGSCHLHLCYSTEKTNCRGKENVKVHDMPSAENNPWKNEKTSSSFQIKRDPIEETFLLHCTMQYFHSVPKWPVEPAPWNCAVGLRENLISFNKLLRFSEEKWHLLVLLFDIIA